MGDLTALRICLSRDTNDLLQTVTRVLSCGRDEEILQSESGELGIIRH